MERCLLSLHRRMNGTHWSNADGYVPPAVGKAFKAKECFGVSLDSMDEVILGLQLPNNRLSGMMNSLDHDDVLLGLTHIRVLQLQQNAIFGQIKPSFCEMCTLIHVDLGDNMLSGPLPNALGKLENLKSLRLCNNNSVGGG